MHVHVKPAYATQDHAVLGGLNAQHRAKRITNPKSQEFVYWSYWQDTVGAEDLKRLRGIQALDETYP
jgi:hypothetical protein